MSNQLIGQGGQVIQFETWTPEFAKRAFESSRSNRQFRPHHAERILADILGGLWVFNGATFVMSKNGELIDGQHRAWAIWKSGIPQRVLAVREIPDEYMLTIDNNLSRSTGDVIDLSHRELRGLGRSIASGLQQVLVFCRLTGSRIGQGTQAQIAFRDPRLLKAVVDSLALKEAAKKAGCVEMMPIGSNAAIRYLGRLVNQTATDAFLESVSIGLELKKEEPADALRKYIERARARLLRSHITTSTYTIFRAALCCLDKHLRQMPVKKLQVPEYPELTGITSAKVKEYLGLLPSEQDQEKAAGKNDDQKDRFTSGGEAEGPAASL